MIIKTEVINRVAYRAFGFFRCALGGLCVFVSRPPGVWRVRLICFVRLQFRANALVFGFLCGLCGTLGVGGAIVPLSAPERLTRPRGSRLSSPRAARRCAFLPRGPSQGVALHAEGN